MPPGERRRHPRFSVRRTRIRNGLVTGRVINLSLGGLSFESTAGLRVGSRQAFRLLFRERSLKIEGLVRWCRLSRTLRRREGEVVAVFRAGLSFTEVPALFSRRELQSSGEWLDPAFRVPR